MPDVSIIQNDSFEELYEEDSLLTKIFWYFSWLLFFITLIVAVFFHLVEIVHHLRTDDVM